MAGAHARFRNIPKIQANALKFGQKLPQVMEAIIDNDFIQATNHAKENAPWTDRTGDARKSISYENQSNKDRLLFLLYIGVYYGVFLEFANGGKYRILQPTMTIYEVKILKDLQRIGVNMEGGL